MSIMIGSDLVSTEKRVQALLRLERLLHAVTKRYYMLEKQDIPLQSDFKRDKA
jgi:hypothetical protein